jgi:hypothetical protein
MNESKSVLRTCALFLSMVAASACQRGPNTRTVQASEACRPLVTGRWIMTGALENPRIQPSGVVLEDGRVLVSGGREPMGAPRLASAEVYDPVANGWTSVAPMSVQRLGHSLVRLPDGSVLAVGGGIPAVERFDPRTGAWSAVPAPADAARVGAGVFVLSNGRVAIVGGEQIVPTASGEPFYRSVSNILYLDPSTGATEPGPTMDKARSGASFVALGDGTIIAIGGTYTEPPLIRWELFGDRPGPRTRNTEGMDILQPAATSWRRGPWPRTWAGTGTQAVALSTHEVFILAGAGDALNSRKAAVFDTRAMRWRETVPMQTARLGALAVPWSEGCVLVLGGAGPRDPAEVYAVREDGWIAAPPPPHAAATVFIRMLDGSILALGDHAHPREGSRYLPAL